MVPRSIVVVVALALVLTLVASPAVASPSERLVRRVPRAATATPAATPARANPNACPGVPYDFSTSNYCEAERVSGANYAVPLNKQGQPLQLRSVQLITRHGDRTPVNILPHYDVAYDLCDVTASQGFAANPPRPDSSSHDDEDKKYEGRRLEQLPLVTPASVTNPFARQLWQGNCMTGQLTSRGVEQLFQVGRGLREVYVDKLGFFESGYERDEQSFYLRSTDVWRTKQSAEALLSGLWPAGCVNCDVAPMHTYPKEIETMYANYAACPELQKIQKAQYASEAWKTHLNHPDLWKHFDEVMGLKTLPSWHDSFDRFVDNFRTRTCHNLPLPCNPSNPAQCITPQQADFVFSQGDWEYRFVNNESPQSTQLAQVGIGAFMATIRDVLISTVTANPAASSIGAEKFTYYSGHDTTLSAVLGALNVTGMSWPPYASNMLFELWEDAGHAESGSPAGYSLRIVYNGQVLKLFAAGCCEELCPYTNVIQYLNTMIPTNLVDICNTDGRF